MDASAIAWMLGLAIGVLFGWCWGFTEGRRAR